MESGKHVKESIAYRKNLNVFNLKLQIKSEKAAYVKLSIISKDIIFHVGDTTLSWEYLHTLGGCLN